jgi:hypothetical protein
MNIIRPALHHVALKTTRLQEMIDWYSVVLGTDVVHDDSVNAWITNDAANHRIALFALPGQSDDPQKSTHNGIHHTAFEFESSGNGLRFGLRRRRKTRQFSWTAVSSGSTLRFSTNRIRWPLESPILLGFSHPS